MRVWLAAQTSKFMAASPMEGVSRDQICTNPGVDMLDSKRYLRSGLGNRLRAGRGLGVRAAWVGAVTFEKITKRNLWDIY